MDDFAHIVGEDVHFRGRSPSGERGLKSEGHQQGGGVRQSLPIRGAWIEIRVCLDTHRVVRSLPIRGAWIEIGASMTANHRHHSRSPSGERGLKSLREIHARESARRRSPSGERGLKFRRAALLQDFFRRSPSGERGLKSSGDEREDGADGRSPSGERGLKYSITVWTLLTGIVAPHPGSVD